MLTEQRTTAKKNKKNKKEAFSIIGHPLLQKYLVPAARRENTPLAVSKMLLRPYSTVKP
jgi:hypothetical protein